MENTQEVIRLLESKRQSFAWRTTFGEKFTYETLAAYNRSAAILFPRVPCLSYSQVLAVYDHALKQLASEIDWDDLDHHGPPDDAEIRHSGGH